MYNAYPTHGSKPLPMPFSTGLLESKIHHIIFNIPSQSVIAEWLRCLETIYRQGGNRAVLTLTDARRSVMPPLAYVTHLSQMLTAEHKLRIRTKNAILHRNGPLDATALEITQSLLRNGGHRVRFYYPDEKSSAIRWLLADD
jgi:hypothetical protein